MKRHFFCLCSLKFYLIFSLFLYISGVQAKFESTFLPSMSLLPAHFLNKNLGGMRQSVLNQNSFNVFKRQDNKEISYQQDDLFTSSNNSQKMNHIRIFSPYSFGIYAASIKPSVGTVCHAEVSSFDDGKFWQCYNKAGQQAVSIDLYLSETDDNASVSLATNQAMTIHYAPLLEGGKSLEPLSELYRDDGMNMVRTLFDQQLLLQEKVGKAKQVMSSMVKVSVRQVLDDPAMQSIYLKLVKGHSREEEEEFQQNLDEYRSVKTVKVKLKENADDIALKPDSCLELSVTSPEQGAEFPGMINRLVGSDGGGKSSGSQQKGNEKSSTESNHTDNSRETHSPSNNGIGPLLLSDEALQIAGKEGLIQYIINGCNTSGTAQPASYFSKIPQDIRLIKQCVNKYREPDTVTENILADFVSSAYGERLHRKAAASNLVQLEKFIREAGVAINAQSKKSGNTPIIIAAKNNHWDMVEILLRHAPLGSVAVKNKSQKSVLDYLLTQTTYDLLGHIKFKKMLQRIMKNAVDPGPLSVSDGFPALALEQVADTFFNVELFDTALKAIPFGQSHPFMNKSFLDRLILRTANSGADRYQMISYLLQLKNPYGHQIINPNAVTPSGNTPLMLAAMRGNVNVVKALLQDDRVKQNINYLNLLRLSPYSAYTAAHYWGNQRIMELLAEAGAVRHKASPTRAQLQAEALPRNANSGGSNSRGLAGGCSYPESFSSYDDCD